MLAVIAAAAALAGITACTATSDTSAIAGNDASATARNTATPGNTGTPSPRPSVTAKPTPRPRPASPPRVVVTKVRAPDGSDITIAIFRGPVRYVLHNGAVDPGPMAARVVREGPSVTGTERRMLLAGFNGGFKLNAGAGGYEQEGHVIKPLLPGYASLVIDRSGQARIVVWGSGAPARGEAVYSVRQNLTPLVLDGRLIPGVVNWGAWGGTVGGLEDVARSALGEDRDGELIYAGSMSATPADLAAVLIRAGARIAMELDINPNWVQLDVASRPGGPLRAQVPGQWRPADQFLVGWDRDFIAVLG
jgi:hypothetical protein